MQNTHPYRQQETQTTSSDSYGSTFCQKIDNAERAKHIKVRAGVLDAKAQE